VRGKENRKSIITRGAKRRKKETNNSYDVITKKVRKIYVYRSTTDDWEYP